MTMTFFGQLKLKTQLWAVVLFPVFIGLVIATYCAVQFRTISQDAQTITDRRINNMVLVADIKENGNTIARSVRNYLLVNDEKTKLEITEQINSTDADHAELLAKLAPSLNLAKGKALFANMVAERQQFMVLSKKAMTLQQSQNHDRAIAVLFNEMRPIQLKYLQSMDDLAALQVTAAKALVTQVEENGKLATLWVASLASAAALLSMVFAWQLIRSVTRAIGGEPRYAVAIASHVAAGNLNVDVEVHRDDSHSVVATMRAMRDSLVAIVSQVRAASDSIATGSHQITAGNAHLSQRTEEQASNLEETAAAMEQLTATVKSNAATALQATSLANSAKEVAVKGGEMVSEVVTTMRDISISGSKIGDIIGVIDSIAFQTNLLALNAAVEAARAGEQGRGFAVVAGEVRSLAGRTAEAAKQIKTLINANGERVERGSQLADNAGETMSDIVAQVKRVADLIAEISTATKEQTQGIQQVNTAVAHLDQMTQQNTALVEESAAAADSLNKQAERLVQVVSIFQLGHGDTAEVIAKAMGERPTRQQIANKQQLALAVH